MESSGGGLIDNLQYNYYGYSNKLLNVIDGVNDLTTKLGDFRASELYMQSLPGGKQAQLSIIPMMPIIELEGLEAMSLQDSRDPKVRALARDNVQKEVEASRRNFAESGSLTIKAGKGVGYKARAGSLNLEGGVGGPEAAVTLGIDGIWRQRKLGQCGNCGRWFFGTCGRRAKSRNVCREC